MSDSSIGLIGLGPMGTNLALHLLELETPVSVFSYDADERAGFADTSVVADSLHGFIESLAKPRKILLMLTAGQAVDRVIGDLLPALTDGDTIIDGGNSHFRDTERRQMELEESGIFFIGLGISGGAEGARHGAAMMAGGAEVAVTPVRPLLEPLTAKRSEDHCFVHAGPGGAGHFVKMVHNGIEYGLMQLIAETWDFLDRGIGIPRERQAAMFRAWRGGPVSSYLVEITGEILAKPDELDSGWLLDQIDDRAGHKGTGRWTVEAALALGVPVPVIAAAVNERMLSSSSRGAQKMPPGTATEDSSWPLMLEQSLLTGFAATFIQGFELLEAASAECGWSVDTKEIARGWREGCIVRAKLLDRFANGALPSVTGDFADLISGSEQATRRVLTEAISIGLPMPALAAAVSWIDSKRADNLPTRLIQAQRDYFGAHGYRRSDRGGEFSSDWKSW